MKAITRELEETRKEYQAQIDKLKAEKGQGEAGLRRQLEDSRRQMEEQARAAASHLQRVEMERDATVAALRERLRALQADREADAKHLHAKIDRLKNIHSAALSAGSARGRSLLYAEAMKSPEVLKHSTMTWRGEDWVPTGHSVNSQTLHLPEGLQYEYKPDDDTSPYTAWRRLCAGGEESVARSVASLYYREADNGATLTPGDGQYYTTEGATTEMCLLHVFEYLCVWRSLVTVTLLDCRLRPLGSTLAAPSAHHATQAPPRRFLTAHHSTATFRTASVIMAPTASTTRE